MKKSLKDYLIIWDYILKTSKVCIEEYEKYWYIVLNLCFLLNPILAELGLLTPNHILTSSLFVTKNDWQNLHSIAALACVKQMKICLRTKNANQNTATY